MVEYIGQAITDGFYDPIVIIGFPYDEGARKAGSRAGANFGPDSFRRFLKMANIGAMDNPEMGVNINEKLKICDYGNIQIENCSDLLKLYEKLGTKVGLCIQRGNIPFVVGGSRDLLQAYGKGDFVCVTPCTDMEPLLADNLCHQTSVHRKLQETGKVFLFGVDGSRTPKLQALPNTTYISEIQAKGCKASFEKLLTEVKESGNKFHFCLNLEAITEATGVSTNCASGGISAQEAC